MNRAPLVAYTPDEHERVQLGVRADHSTPGVVRIVVSANLVATNAPAVSRLALDAIRALSSVTIDLSRSAYVDSRGFGMLVSLANAANRAGGHVTIAGAHPDLLALFDRHAIARLFTFAPNIEPGDTP